MTSTRVTYGAIGVLVGTCLASAAEPAGPVAAWTFDDIRGRVVVDATGHGHDAVVTGGFLVPGVRGAAMLSDGTRTRCRAAGAGELQRLAAFSVDAWIKLTKAPMGGFPAVVRKEGSFALRFSNGKLGALIWSKGRTVDAASRRATWPTGRWMHVAMTCDGKQVRVFVAGKEDARPAACGAIDESNSGVFLASSIAGAHLPGAVDEVRLWDRALSAEEVLAACRAGRRSLARQKGKTFEPKEIGAAARQFRKPPRNVAMVKEGLIWIDAEDFDDYGGWWIDTQFVHLMGSSYLIAAGVGTPVKDATTTLTVPKAGRYRIWVRSRDWYKSHSPGTFQLLVNGRPAAKTFGQDKSGTWVWLSAGEFALKAGPLKLALHDLTGYYGRCDAIVLTTDLTYRPPDQTQRIVTARAALTGLDLTPKPQGAFDVIVVGAGAAGSCAAIASARAGAKTALIQNRPVLGGNASSELGVGINGAASAHRNARESGIIEECGRIRARYGYPKMSEPFRLVAEREKNLTVFLNRHVFAAEMVRPGHIAAVKAVDTLTGEITTYRARVFIDCTGDGWLGFFAGAEYRRGRESRDQHGESLAPAKADELTMSGCIMGGRGVGYTSVDAGKPVTYTPPAWAPKFPPFDQFGRRPRGLGGQWWLEHPNTIDDIHQAEYARDELIRISFGYWDWIKNVSPYRKQAANRKMVSIPIVDAKRESRRLIGDYILTQQDVQAGRVFPDRISHGGWPIDVHHPEGIYSGKPGPFYCNPRVPIYTVPFRCLYSKNVDNLLMAGRCMSVTHIALGTVRVQGTLAAMGQVSGTAAAWCARDVITPRTLGRKHIAAFQQHLLRDDQYIPGLRNTDPADLARQAKVTASSTAEYDEFTRSRFRAVRRDRLHPLNMPRAMMLPRGRSRRIDAIHCLLANTSAKPVEVTLHLRASRTSGDFLSTRDLATAKAAVAPGRARWVAFDVKVPVDAPFIWAWLDKAENVFWTRMADAPYGACRAYGGEGKWTTLAHQYYAMVTDPPSAVPAKYQAGNVINGLTRIIGKEPNLWSSDPAGKLPQHLDLTWDKPAALTTVYVTFDTDMNAPFHTVPLVPKCVRDYDLSYHDGKAWRVLAKVRGNFQRRRVHRFGAVRTRKLRLRVQATHGEPSARVFEVRAYGEE